MKRKYIVKLNLILSLLIFDILILKVWKAGLINEAYEISIYQNIRTELGLIAFFTLILPPLLYSFSDRADNIIKIGSILLPFLGIISFYSLPILKNYFTYGTADPLGHAQAISYIVKYGSLSPISSKYPVNHVLGGLLYMVITPEYSAFKITRMGYVLPILYNILFIIFSTIVLTHIFKFKIHPLPFVLLLMPIFSYYHVTIYPHALSLMSVPMFVYTYWNFLRSYEARWFVFSLVVITYLVFSHPVPILGLIIGLILTYSALQLIKFENINVLKVLPLIYLVILTVRVISDENLLREGPILAIDYLFNPYTHLPRQKDISVVLEISLGDRILIFLKMYGSILLLDALGMVAIFEILKKVAKKETKSFEFLSLIALTIGMILTHLLGFLGTQRITYGRLLGLDFGFWSLPILLYMYYSDKIFSTSIKKTLKLAIYAVVVLILIGGMLSCYRSPWVYQSNWERTEKLTIGEFWFLSESKFADKTERSKYAIAPMGTRLTFNRPLTFPEHFGFYNGSSPDKYFRDRGYVNGYILLSDIFKETVKSWKLPYNLLPANYFYGGITIEDFKKLRAYYNVSKIYDNSDLEVFYG